MYFQKGNASQAVKTHLELLCALSEEPCNSFHASPEIYFLTALGFGEEVAMKCCVSSVRGVQINHMHFACWCHFYTSCRNPDSEERSQIPGFFFEVNEGSSRTEV